MIILDKEGKPHHYTKINPENIFKELDKFISNLPFDIKYTTDHWTAGSYQGFYHTDSYHFLIQNDCIYVSNEIATRWHYHAWNRNANNLGLAFMAMAGANSKSMGKYPVTDNMIENMAKVRAVLKDYYKLDWNNMVDHAYWALLDKYYPDRWDNRFKLPEGVTITEKTQAKSKWYYDKYLKDKK